MPAAEVWPWLVSVAKKAIFFLVLAISQPVNNLAVLCTTSG